MTITTTTLTRAAGVAAVVGGLLYIGVQIRHPNLDLGGWCLSHVVLACRQQG